MNTGIENSKSDEIKESANEDCCENESYFKKGGLIEQVRKNLSSALMFILAVVVLVNIVVMSVFAITVNNKLDMAIALNEPLKAEIMIVMPVDCPACGDMSAYKKLVLAQNIEATEDSLVSSDTDRGRALIERHSLTNLPALILTTEEDIDAKIIEALPQGHRSGEGGALVWEQASPPYYNLQSSQVEGMISITYITDGSCEECYNVVAVQKPALLRFGLALDTENTVDINTPEGESLKKKYNISAVPTVILSSEASKYLALQSVWKQVGTIEPDGVHVFREMKALGATYKDLSTGKVVSNEE